MKNANTLCCLLGAIYTCDHCGALVCKSCFIEETKLAFELKVGVNTLGHLSEVCVTRLYPYGWRGV